MKKSILITLFMFFSVAFACSSKSIIGHIQIYGNAPFTFVGFITESGEKYSLDVDSSADFSIKDIKKNQGKRLKLTGSINEKELQGFQTLKNGRFIVKKYKILTGDINENDKIEDCDILSNVEDSISDSENVKNQ